jgi:hypothetical protein
MFYNHSIERLMTNDQGQLRALAMCLEQGDGDGYADHMYFPLVQQEITTCPLCGQQVHLVAEIRPINPDF